MKKAGPPIWRSLQVSPDITLPRFHIALQIAIGWANYHLHEFISGGKSYCPPDPDESQVNPEFIDERRVRLKTLLPEVGASCRYLYDFGDNWLHKITLEAVEPAVPRKRYPVCVDGARGGPPEDAGGVDGYEYYLRALFDPKHRDHKEKLQWRGRFDPEFFSLSGVNQSLRAEFPLPVQKRKPPLVAVTYVNRGQKVIAPEFPIPVRLTAADRELILEHTFADPELTDRLQTGIGVVHYTLADLDELIGFVAAEANHSAKKMQKAWDALFDKLSTISNSFTCNNS